MVEGIHPTYSECIHVMIRATNLQKPIDKISKNQIDQWAPPDNRPIALGKLFSAFGFWLLASGFWQSGCMGAINKLRS